MKISMLLNEFKNLVEVALL